MVHDKVDFEQIYASFQPTIYRYLTRLVGTHEAEDLTQEVFIKVEKALPTFRKEAQLSTWLYRIATHAAIDRMRQPSFRRELASEQADEPTRIKAGSANPCSLEEQVMHQETSTCIRAVIDKLPETYRLAVILSDLEGLKNKEIAAILDASLDVVKMRLHRGRAQLKKELLQYCHFYWDERNELTCDPKSPLKK